MQVTRSFWLSVDLVGKGVGALLTAVGAVVGGPPPIFPPWLLLLEPLPELFYDKERRCEGIISDLCCTIELTFFDDLDEDFFDPDPLPRIVLCVLLFPVFICAKARVSTKTMALLTYVHGLMMPVRPRLCGSLFQDNLPYC